MKKIFVLCLCLILAATVPGLTAVASAETEDASDIIYFLNPRAITVLGDRLFVADIIESNKSVVLCFDIGGDKPVYKFTSEIEGEIVNLSSTDKGEASDGDPLDGGKRLYAMFADKVIEYLVMDSSLGTAATFDVQGAKDFVFGTETGNGDGKGEYYATDNNVLRRIPDDEGFMNLGLGSLTSVVGIVSIDKYVYCVYETNGKLVAQRFDGDKLGVLPNDVFNNESSTPAIPKEVKGVFAYNGSSLGLYSNNRISYIDVGVDSCTDVSLLAEYDSDNAQILDVELLGDKAYVLNNQNKIEIYSDAKPLGAWTKIATIGSEVLERKVPDIKTDLTSFTLVRSSGYPGNIIFKTTGDNSVENIVKDADEYIVLGYDGDSECNYYYVLYRDSFGWVKKSDNATSPEDDAKLNVVDTRVTAADPQVSKMRTKFTSLGGVFVYPLPRNSYATEEYQTVVENSATNRKEVTVLQRFADGDTVWYYVEFEDGGELRRGFVKKAQVGEFTVVPANTQHAIVGNFKANTFLFGTVTVYDNGIPETMNDDHLSKLENGETLRLRSGQRVTVISIDEQTEVAFVQIPNEDGTYNYGYVYFASLIKTTALTTNAAVGLALVGIAVILAIVLTSVFVRKHKKKKPVGSTASTGSNE